MSASLFRNGPMALAMALLIGCSAGSQPKGMTSSLTVEEFNGGKILVGTRGAGHCDPGTGTCKIKLHAIQDPSDKRIYYCSAVAQNVKSSISGIGNQRLVVWELDPQDAMLAGARFAEEAGITIIRDGGINNGNRHVAGAGLAMERRPTPTASIFTSK